MQYLLLERTVSRMTKGLLLTEPFQLIIQLKRNKFFCLKKLANKELNLKFFD